MEFGSLISIIATVVFFSLVIELFIGSVTRYVMSDVWTDQALWPVMPVSVSRLLTCLYLTVGSRALYERQHFLRNSYFTQLKLAFN